MAIILYILFPSIIVMLFMLGKKTSGSDHPIHISIIDRIKKNNHRFLADYVLSLNEKYAFYPQLFHWGLSFLPEKIYKKKYVYISVFVKLLEIVSFNCFLFFLYERVQFEKIIFLYANVIINVFPFTYTIWNAKNNGLSARGIGLLIGQIYTYLIVTYVLTGNMLLLPALFVSAFIIILMSQMATQYLLLSLPFFVIFFKIPEIIFLPFLAFGLFYLSMPQVSKNYIIGQFNHKRNYALYDAKIFFNGFRPSIYRDFVYDFWIKLKKDFLTGLVYIFFNPLIEIIYGLPFLWFVLFIGFKNGFNNESEIFFYTILSALGLFFLTSFRWTRFLGEPGRYLEFVIPFITILYVLKFGLEYHIAIVTGCILIIIINSFILNKHARVNPKNINRIPVISFLEEENKYLGKVCISNDNELLKHFAGKSMEIVRVDPSIYIKNNEEYYKNYYNQNVYVLSPFALEKFYNEFDVDLLVLNTDFYNIDVLNKTFKPHKITFIKDIGNFQLYEL